MNARTPRDGRLYAALALLVGAVLVGVQVYLACTSANSFLKWFHFDDAFYYFKTAQNIVAGRGPTFDGTGPTNGFHPLWMALLLPVFAVARGDLILPLRLVLVLVGLLLGGAVAVFYREGRRHFGAAAVLLVLGAWLLTRRLYLQVVAGGMESALSVLGLLTFWAALAAMERTRRETDPRAVAVVGLTAAFAMLARLDNALLVAVAGLMLLARWRRARVDWRQMLRLALAFGLPGFVSVGAFLLWSRLAVGTWLPVSSQVKMWWGGLDGTFYGRAWRYCLVHTMGRFLHTPLTQWYPLMRHYAGAWAPHLAGAGVMGAAALAFGWWFWQKQTRLRATFRRAALDFMLWGTLFHACYLKVCSGLSPLRDWYWSAEIVIAALLAAFLLQWLFSLAAGFLRWQSALAGLTAVAVVLMSVAFLRWAWRAYPLQNDHLHVYLQQARWVEARTRPDDVLGASGTGALAYFTPERKILNLDGLIAPLAYLQALQAGQGSAYLQAQGLKYVVGNYWLTQAEPYRHIFANHLQPIATDAYDGLRMTLYEFRP